MSPTRAAVSAATEDSCARAVERQTQALLSSVLDDFLVIDLQFQPVLDGFTGGNVLTYLSREADRLAGVLLEATGRPAPPFEARQQWDVDAGGLRPAAVLIEDVVESAARLQDATAGVGDWTALDDDVREVPARRLVQLVVHSADLDRSWASLTHEDAAVAVAQLPAVLAGDLGGTRLVVRPDQPLASTTSIDGEAVLTGDARALLAWASGRLHGVDTAAVELPAPARRTWF